MYGVNMTRPSFGTISKNEQTEILKKLAKRSSKCIEVPTHDHSEPEHSSKSQKPNDIIASNVSNYSNEKKVDISENAKLNAENAEMLTTEEEYTLNATTALKQQILEHSDMKNEISYDANIELRNTFFKLSLLAVILSFASWVILMVIMLLLNIKCPNIIYCIILEPTLMSESCVVNGNNSSSLNLLMIILTLWVVLISIVYALLWQYFWRSKHNPLWKKHQKDITKLITKFLSLPNKSKLITRTIKVWSMLIICLSLVLVIEYIVEQYLYFPGGRYFYCFMVLTFGVILIKIIGFITTYEYNHYHNSMEDDSDSAVLIEADSRNCRFHRQILLVIMNTTYALYVPTIRVYPNLNSNIKQQDLQIYLQKLNQSAIEATFFLWSAVISSQCLAFGIEMFNAYIFGKCFAENKRRNCCSQMCFIIAAGFTMFTAKELYFLHENWFLAVILFYYGVTFSWLNPSIFLIAALSLSFLCFIYKIRFILLNPQMVMHFVPDIIMLETILFILVSALPTQFFLLFPLYNNCKWISFGGIIIGAILTVCVVILYYFIFRIKKLVKTNNQINDISSNKEAV